jgi:hypothetical protein
MVRRQHVDVRIHTSADASTVYALLRDGATWLTWSSIDSFQLERAGDREPEGPGTIRVFRKGRVTGKDQIVGLVPNRRFSYRHVTGLPVRHYDGDVELESIEGVTRIRWHVLSHRSCPAPGGCGGGESGDL